MIVSGWMEKGQGEGGIQLSAFRIQRPQQFCLGVQRLFLEPSYGPMPRRVNTQILRPPATRPQDDRRGGIKELGSQTADCQAARRETFLTEIKACSVLAPLNADS
jgi:hypothetical protein